jgi:hypothetical protein
MNAPSCIYCGEKKLTREHFVPKSLGGTRAEKFACAKCNNGFLSELDNELAGRSPLSLVAADELREWFRNSWDVDYANGNLLLEGHADSRNRSLTLWPQIVFDEDGPHTYGDNEEIERFGRERFHAVFFQHLLSAFQTLSEKRPRFIVERVPVPAGPCRFPPRVFAAHPIREFSNKMHFQCRYLRASDKRRAYAYLGDWHLPRAGSVAVRRGSTCPPLRVTYDRVLVLRALMKLDVNLIRFACERTTVHRTNFSDAIRLVTGESPIRRHVTTKCGFVYAEDIGQLGCPPVGTRPKFVGWDKIVGLDKRSAAPPAGRQGKTPGWWNCAALVPPYKSIIKVRGPRCAWQTPNRTRTGKHPQETAIAGGPLRRQMARGIAYSIR